MTTIRPFRALDLYKFNHINLDALTETYTTSFYTVSALLALLPCNSLIAADRSNTSPLGQASVRLTRMPMAA